MAAASLLRNVTYTIIDEQFIYSAIEGFPANTAETAERRAV